MNQPDELPEKPEAPSPPPKEPDATPGSWQVEVAKIFDQLRKEIRRRR